MLNSRKGWTDSLPAPSDICAEHSRAKFANALAAFKKHSSDILRGEENPEGTVKGALLELCSGFPSRKSGIGYAQSGGQFFLSQSEMLTIPPYLDRRQKTGCTAQGIRDSPVCRIDHDQLATVLALRHFQTRHSDFIRTAIMFESRLVVDHSGIDLPLATIGTFPGEWFCLHCVDTVDAGVYRGYSNLNRHKYTRA